MTQLSYSALIIDHDDSFIWNIKFWLEPEFKVTMIHHAHTSSLNLGHYDLIVLSPGPKSPQDYPLSLKLLSTLQQPVLGICLGFQMMTMVSRGSVEAYSPPKHGKTSLLKSQAPFDQLAVGRYHSLHCKPGEDFKVLATSLDDNCIMWSEHKTKKQIGFQFHPESFLTESADLYKKYILEWMPS
ncbi:MAG: gamma-glutamyl-gamma-aminobutyrate hydrolase family protein [Bdellovibrionaceae bacterium]|nr:gamma-glutamyl-gamma-aminobutyrate hydrolase family protein [Pseudobdellovibrionaceae bacterium]